MFRDIKPTFGGGDFNSTATSTPFGEPTSSVFTAPEFGSDTSSLFGSNVATAGSVFGGATTTPVFGEVQTTQSTGFAAAPQTPSPFGTPKSEAPSAFASPLSPFSAFENQQNTTQNIGLFGPKTPFSTTTTTPAFGGFGQPWTNTTNAFGTGGAFGTQTSVGGFGGGLFSTAQNNTGGGLSLRGRSSFFAPAKRNNIFGSNTMGSFEISGFGTTGGLGSLGGGLGNPLLQPSLTGRWKLSSRVCSPGRPPRWKLQGGGGWAASPPSRGPVHGRFPACLPAGAARGRRSHTGASKTSPGMSQLLTSAANTHRWKFSSRVCSPGRPPGWKLQGSGGRAVSPPSRGPVHGRFPACLPAGAARGRRSHTGASKTSPGSSRGSTSAANTLRISDGLVRRRRSALRRPRPPLAVLANLRPTPQTCLTRNPPLGPEELSARRSRVEESVKKTFSSVVSPSSTAPQPDNEPCLQ